MRGTKDKSGTKDKVWRGKDASNRRNETMTQEFSHSRWGGRYCLMGRESERTGFGPAECIEVLHGEGEEEEC